MSKTKPYCARTLRHAARLAGAAAGQYGSLAKSSKGQQVLYYTYQFSTLMFVSALLKKEARAIERKAKP